MTKRAPSRPQRWSSALSDARSALDDLETAKERLETAVQELADLKDEYGEWRDNLPENLAGGAVAEKLDAIVELDLDRELDMSDVSDMVDEVEGVELPLGFGRD